MTEKQNATRLPVRREAFARELARDLADPSKTARPLAEVHKAAGMSGDRGNASRLYNDPAVQARVTELLAEMTADFDLDSIDSKAIVAALVKEAMTAESDGARVQALKLLAQWRAMLVQVREDRAAALSDVELATSISGFNPEAQENGGNELLYLLIMEQITGASAPADRVLTLVNTRYRTH